MTPFRALKCINSVVVATNIPLITAAVKSNFRNFVFLINCKAASFEYYLFATIIAECKDSARQHN
jgi:hypothetical protein